MGAFWGANLTFLILDSDNIEEKSLEFERYANGDNTIWTEWSVLREYAKEDVKFDLAKI